MISNGQTTSLKDLLRNYLNRKVMITVRLKDLQRQAENYVLM